VDLPVADRWFASEDMGGGVTRLWEPHVDPFLESNVWHVRGAERDLLVDAGNGVGSLADAIAPLRAGRDIVAVATHAHFDHVGGLGAFSDRRAHVLDAEMPTPGPLVLVREAFPDWLVEDYRYYGSPLPDDLALLALPAPGFDPAAWSTPAVRPTSTVADGDAIDLGDRRVEVVHTPGHTPGSICLWESATGTLFSGDAFYMDAPLGLEDRAAFVASLRRIAELPVRVVHTGHGRSVDGSAFGQEIDRLLGSDVDVAEGSA
jgi:glyoxylase-like metal-dependent hydrolase (beta-lactamase superfamily II)